MGIRNLELYLDESGDFNDGKENRPSFVAPSVVGGILCEKGWMTKKRLMEAFHGTQVHACRSYKSYFLPLLQDARNEGCRFVIFENNAKIRVIDSNFTYINIICEGLVHLFRDLAIEYPDGVRIKVIIAKREMPLQEYEIRIRERLAMALARNCMVNRDYELVISDARNDARLYYADIICNTWFTKDRQTKRNGEVQGKFSSEERAIIDRIYDPKRIYSVFENVSTTFLNLSLEERHIGESMFWMCTLPKQPQFIKLRDKMLDLIGNADSYEQDTWFTQMSLLIGQYNRMRNYEDGIKLAENYIRDFLSELPLTNHLARAVPFWTFDTNYHLLTMYDHIGNLFKCRECLQKCFENIAAVNRTWEHIDYYFGFRIRELNVLMGCFAFQEVIQRAKKLEKIFKEARELFGLIENCNETGRSVRSELLGKVYGVQLEVAINLLHHRPELYDDALRLSDLALAEFDDARDISRQYQWRCLLMVEGKKPEEAYSCLLKALGAEEKECSMETLLDRIYSMHRGSHDFLLWHFSNVMLLFREMKHPLGDKMLHALKRHSQFLQSFQDEEKGGHPWNLVLWNMARCARMDGNDALHKHLHRRTIKVTRENKDNVTMLTFAVSMSAEHALWCRRNNGKAAEKAMNELVLISMELERAGVTDEIKSAFRLPECRSREKVTDTLLAEVSNAYLR